jgi:hypothetical protein
MSVPDIIFLTAVCAGFGVFMIVLGSAAWYCRETLIEERGEPERQPAKARVTRRPTAV